MHPRVKSVRHVRDYTLEITFRNNRTARVDLTDVVRGGGIWRSLRPVEVFGQVRVDPDFGTLVWPGDIDICPDVLYWMATGAPIKWATDPKYHKPPPNLRKPPKRKRPLARASKR